jgi:hypothetical protein
MAERIGIIKNTAIYLENKSLEDILRLFQNIFFDFCCKIKKAYLLSFKIFIYFKMFHIEINRKQQTRTYPDNRGKYEQGTVS